MPKRPKYGNRKCTANGITFDSQLERDRYFILKDYERQGIISDIAHQPSFDLIVKDQLICRIEPDFVYVMNGHEVIEDCKSPFSMTAAFNIKRKLFRAIYGLDIFIVQKQNLSSLPDS